MTTAPFAPEAETLITGPHAQVVKVAAAHPSWDVDIPLEVDAATLTWDESRAPRVSASLSCRVPTDQDVLDLLDPRTGVRIQITAGYVSTAGVSDVHLLADLGLRSRRVSRPGNQLQLDAASDEALVIDGSAVQTVVKEPAEVLAILRCFVQALPSARVVIDPRVGMAASEPVDMDSVTDLWSTIDDLADRVDADVYDDGLRTFQVVPRPELASTSAATIKVGANGTLISSDATISRDAWFNSVHLDYAWKVQVDKDTTRDVYALGLATQYTGPFGTDGNYGGNRRVYYERREVPTTGAGAQRAAEALLRRMLSRGRSYSISAVSALWLRAGDTITVQLPTGAQARHLVAAVTFDLVAGSMDVTTRLPIDLNTLGE